MTPTILKPYEIEIRNIINEGLERGSVECLFNIKYNGSTKPVTVNTELLKAYYNSVKDVATELNADDNNLLSAILRLPDVVTNSTDNLNEDEWKQFVALLKSAIENLNIHRQNEGAALEKELLKRVDNIELHEKGILQLEPQRREK